MTVSIQLYLLHQSHAPSEGSLNNILEEGVCYILQDQEEGL